MHKTPSKYMYLFGGAIGDALLGVHIGRLLSSAVPQGRLLMLSTRHNPLLEQLLAPMAFVSYRELPKGEFRSWLTLARLAATSTAVTYLEPFKSPVSIWWRIILIALGLRNGSVRVRCSIRARPGLAERLIAYDCRTDHIFDLPKKILKEWEINAVPQQPYLDPGLYSDSEMVKPYILLHFFAPTSMRSVPVARARELLRAVHEEFPDHALVMSAGPSDREKAERIAADLPAIVEQTSSMSQLCSLVKDAVAYVGVDTGVTHVACHLGVPSIVLGNLSNPCWLPTYAPQAIILTESARCGCRGDKTGNCFEETPDGRVYRCLLDIPLESVLGALKEVVH